MKTQWSPSWNKSKQPRKQRKFIFQAPLHAKRRMMASHLSKDLRQKYGSRSTTIRIGDKVKIVRGQFKGKIGKVSRINTSDFKVFVEGVELLRKDGSKAFPPIHPSNLMITEVIAEDKKRFPTKTAKVTTEKKQTETKTVPQPKSPSKQQQPKAQKGKKQ